MEKIEETAIIESDDLWEKPSTERLIKGGLWYNIFDIIGSLVNTIFIMVISRIPVGETALLAKIDTFRGFLLAFATLGFVGAGAKFFSEYLGRKDLHQAKMYAAVSIKYNFLLTGIPAVAIATIFALTIPTDPTERVGFILLIFIVLFDRIRSCSDIILLGYQRYDLWSTAYFLPYIIGWVVGALLIGPFGVIGAVAAFLMASVGSCILSIWFTNRLAPFPLRDLLNWGEMDPIFGKILKFNIMYALANLAYSLLIGSLLITQTTILGTFSDLETSTYYVIIGYLTLYIGIFGIVNPINQAISEAHAMRNVPLMHNYVKTVVKFPILMAVPVTAVLLLMGAEIIEAINGPKYVNIGYFFILVFLPGYAFGSFAAKYDNILAGVGRPETPMLPWIIGLSIAILGIASTVWLPSDAVPFPQMFPDVSLRFAVSVGSLTLGLFIAGTWIIYMTLRIFTVKIPREYFTRPLLTSIIVAAFYLLIKNAFNPRALLVHQMGVEMGNVFYVVIMITVLLGLFIPLLVFLGGASREDGRFILRLFGDAPWLRTFLRPFIAIARWCFAHQIMAAEETHWITREEKAEIFESQLFSVEILPLSSNIKKLTGDSQKDMHPSSEDVDGVEFRVKITNNGDDPLHQFLVYIKIPGHLQTAGYIDQLQLMPHSETELSVVLKKSEIPSNRKEEIYVCVECYSANRAGLTPQQQLKKGLWTWFDYRLRWYYEEEFLLPN